MLERYVMLIYNNDELSDELILKRAFYNRKTIPVAIDLVGKILSYKTEQGTLAGKVVEVEAYLGVKDPACHAYVGKTRRSKIFWEDPGLAYVFVTYGIHHCLNTITEKPNVPGCVLIRAVEPIMGMEQMKKNRAKEDFISLTNGPGKLTQAFGITLKQNGVDLTNSELAFYNNRQCDEIVVTSRIGISKAKQEPLRFVERKSPFVSNPNRKVQSYFEGSSDDIMAAFTEGDLCLNLV